VRVCRPRVCSLDTIEEVPERLRNSCPETERTVDVEPCVFAAVANIGDYGERVERSSVHLSGLRADDRRLATRTQLLGEHPPASIDRNDLGRRPKPEHAQRPVDRAVPSLADEHANARRAVQTISLDIPTGLAKDMMARRCESGEVGHLGSGDEPEGRIPRQTKQLDKPRSSDLLDHRNRRPADIDPCVLIPD
jgi:hypothetical protein